MSHAVLILGLAHAICFFSSLGAFWIFLIGFLNFHSAVSQSESFSFVVRSVCEPIQPAHSRASFPGPSFILHPQRCFLSISGTPNIWVWGLVDDCNLLSIPYHFAYLFVPIY